MAPSPPDPDSNDILHDIPILYELSLSIGTSLDLQKNCEFFVQKLMTRKSLSFVGVYTNEPLQRLPDQPLTASEDYHCIYACPQMSSLELEQLISTELLLKAKSQGVLCLNTAQSSRELLLPALIESFPGIVSVFSVCQGKSIIVLINQIRDNQALDNIYSSCELNQLSRLLDKFGRSIEACFKHAALRHAIETKVPRQQKLERSQHSESLGVMAGGIAHDLGNILNPLAAYPDILSRSFTEGSREQLMLSQIQDAVDKASAMMQDLLVLTRKSESVHGPVPLALPIHQYSTSASFRSLQASKPNIRCHWELETNSQILADNTMITRIILNLVANAFEALNGLGDVEIKVYDRALTTPHRGYITIPAGQYVVLAVRDNGEGIPQKALGRIFEPFFSKKNLGRSGSGLGLAVVYSLVERLRGWIDIQTGTDGTSFAIYFPKLPQTTSPSRVNTPASSQSPTDHAPTHPKGDEQNAPAILHSNQSAEAIILNYLATMPETWVLEFTRIVSSLNTQLIEEQVDNIPAEHGSMKQAIQYLTQRYRYDILLKIFADHC